MDTMATRKHVSIREEQDEWLRETERSPSLILQNAIDERMNGD